MILVPLFDQIGGTSHRLYLNATVILYDTESDLDGRAALWRQCLPIPVATERQTLISSNCVASFRRRALLAGVALIFLVGPPGFANRAEAQWGFFQTPYYRSQTPYYYRSRPDFSTDFRSIPRPDAGSRSGPKADRNSKPEPAKDIGSMPKGPLQVVVSISSQHVTLYSNGVQVTESPVSTGIPGKPTPTGVFSIIQKDRFHRSNLYSNAPMPYMERITWSGVALHEGPLPGYPASHGCIRLTHDFAVRLWAIARLGVRVIVARNDVEPVEFSHPHLFQPRPKPEAPPLAAGAPERPAGVFDQLKFARAGIADPAIAASGASGGRVDAGRGANMPVRPVADPPVMPDPPKPVSDVDNPAKAAPLPTLLRTRGAEQPAKHSGQVAVFISRKEKKLFVRQGFMPLFEVPIEIERPEQPFGTHVFTALGLTDNGSGMRWNVMSIPTEPPRLMAPRIGPTAARAIEVLPSQTAADVLTRIQIPEEAASRIGEMLVAGSSLVISDQGLGPETGQGTDFIVLTR
jgi:hypothetical protein